MSQLDDLVRHEGEPTWRRRDRRLVALLLLILVWMLIGHVDQVVTAPGKVIPFDKVKVIQHFEGGIVKSMMVRENTQVKAGDPLLELDLATGGINKSEMSARMAAMEFERIRLEAEASGHAPVFPDKQEKVHPAIAAAERATYAARHQELAGSLDALASNITQSRQRVAEMQEKLTSLEANLKLAKQELAISEDLVRDKLTSSLDHFQRKAAVERLLGEVAMTRQALPGARAALEESAARRREEEGRFRRRAADEMSELQRKIASLREELGRASDQEKRSVIRSPIDGVVKNVRIQAAGNVVKAGEPILEVVPLKEELVIEVKLSPTDRGYVNKGQFALVKVSAYDFYRYGGLEGKVTGIGADTDIGQKDEQFYRVTVQTDKSHLGTNAADMPISPGMLGEVDIHVGSRSIFWILIKPVLKLRQEAFREV